LEPHSETPHGVQLAPDSPARPRRLRQRSSTSAPRLAILGSRGIPARYGGFETFVAELAPRLVARGIEVTVFCEGARGKKPSELGGVRLEYARAWAPGPLRTLQYDARCLLAALRRFDVVYMLGYGSSPFCVLPRLFGKQVWINMDGLEWRRSKWGLPARAWLWTMERAAFSCASRLVFDSASLRREIETRRGLHVPASVIEYGSELYERDDETGVLEHFGLAPQGYYLAVARAEPENQLLEIVRAHRCAGSARPLAIVTCLDPGNRYARALRAAAGPGTRLLGTLYDARQLRPLRRHACAHVHGQSVGGTNPSLLEAMGCANLVLAHDNPFNRETLGGHGLFWAGEQELVRRFAESEALAPEAREELRRAAFARAREQYSWERIADAYAGLVREYAA
jgi:glycosyltransferase involved in cell wall biosynthesis